MALQMSVNIPPEVLPGIRRLLSLSEEEFQAFVTAIKESEPSPSSSVLAREVASKAQMERSDVRTLITFLGGAFGVLATAEVPVPEAVSAIVRATKRGTESSEILADPKQQEIFERRVTHVLESCEALNVS